MTTCSSIVGLGMMPLNIFLYSQLIIPVDAGNIVPYGEIILNITLTLIPVIVGIMIRNFRPAWVDYILKVNDLSFCVCFKINIFKYCLLFCYNNL